VRSELANDEEFTPGTQRVDEGETRRMRDLEEIKGMNCQVHSFYRRKNGAKMKDFLTQ
jgi:hypothetical protein